MSPAKKPAAGPKVVTADELRTRKRSDRPPEMLGSRELYHGKIITLNRDTVRLPDGNVAEMDIARHSGASAIVPFLSGPMGDEPQVLLIRQYRFAAGGYIYEIPAGRLEPDDDQGAGPPGPQEAEKTARTGARCSKTGARC